MSVPERDVDALADALESDALRRGGHPREARGRRRARVRQDFTWEKALAPLVEFCRDPHVAPDRSMDEELPSRIQPKRVERAQTREERFHQLSVRRHGLGRDIALARYYLTDGGVGMLREKVRTRLATTRASKHGA